MKTKNYTVVKFVRQDGSYMDIWQMNEAIDYEFICYVAEAFSKGNDGYCNWFTDEYKWARDYGQLAGLIIHKCNSDWRALEERRIDVEAA